MITNIKNFKFLNENINNTIYYHGSDKYFIKFNLTTDINNPVYNTNADNGLGIFFTDNLTMAKWFARVIDFNPNSGKYENTNTKGFIYESTLELKNPWILQNNIKNIDEDDAGQTYFNTIEKYGGSKKFKEYLLKNNYDSIIVNNVTTNYYENGDYKIIVVLDPTIINIKKLIQLTNEINICTRSNS